jgi:exonuclease VII large subunit
MTDEITKLTAAVAVNSEKVGQLTTALERHAETEERLLREHDKRLSSLERTRSLTRGFGIAIAGVATSGAAWLKLFKGG